MSGCSLTTAIACSASRARSSGECKRRPLITRCRRNPRNGSAVSTAAASAVRIRQAQFARILALRERGHADLHLVLLLPLVELLGSTLPRCIGVERQHHTAGKSLEHAHVLFGQRRAAGGHRPLHTRSVKADDIGVALAHDHLVGSDDLALRPVQPVQRFRLGVDVGLGRVLVLRRVGRAGQDASAERHRIAVLRHDREHHPSAERVLQPPRLVGERQPRVAQQHRRAGRTSRLIASQSSGAHPNLNCRAMSPASPRLRR